MSRVPPVQKISQIIFPTAKEKKYVTDHTLHEVATLLNANNHLDKYMGIKNSEDFYTLDKYLYKIYKNDVIPKYLRNLSWPFYKAKNDRHKIHKDEEVIPKYLGNLSSYLARLKCGAVESEEDRNDILEFCKQHIDWYEEHRKEHEHEDHQPGYVPYVMMFDHHLECKLRMLCRMFGSCQMRWPATGYIELYTTFPLTEDLDMKTLVADIRDCFEQQFESMKTMQIEKVEDKFLPSHREKIKQIRDMFQDTDMIQYQTVIDAIKEIKEIEELRYIVPNDTYETSFFDSNKDFLRIREGDEGWREAEAAYKRQKAAQNWTGTHDPHFWRNVLA